MYQQRLSVSPEASPSKKAHGAQSHRELQQQQTVTLRCAPHAVAFLMAIVPLGIFENEELELMSIHS